MRSRYNYSDLDEQIRHYINGTLTQEEIDQLWAELLRQPEYLEYFKTSVNLHAVAKEEQVANLPAKQEPGQNPWVRLMAAAVLLIAMAAGFFLWYDQQSVQVVPEAIDRIELDIMRSAAEVPEQDQQPLQQALMMVADEQTDQARKFLDSLRSAAHSGELKIETVITRAVIDYNEGHYAHAGELFEQVLNRPDLSPGQRERAHWYLAQALLRLEEYEQARQHAETVRDIDGAYYRAARRLLDQYDMMDNYN